MMSKILSLLIFNEKYLVNETVLNSCNNQIYISGNNHQILLVIDIHVHILFLNTYTDDSLFFGL